MTWGGGIAAAVGIVCCVSPLLPVVFSIIGAGSVLHYVYSDAVLVPFVVIGLAVMAYGIWTGRQNG